MQVKLIIREKQINLIPVNILKKKVTPEVISYIIWNPNWEADPLTEKKSEAFGKFVFYLYKVLH